MSAPVVLKVSLHQLRSAFVSYRDDDVTDHSFRRMLQDERYFGFCPVGEFALDSFEILEVEGIPVEGRLSFDLDHGGIYFHSTSWGQWSLIYPLITKLQDVQLKRANELRERLSLMLCGVFARREAAEKIRNGRF